MGRRNHRGDKVIDAVGAAAAAIGGAGSAWLVAVETGASPLVWASLAGAVGGFVGMRIMRAVPGVAGSKLTAFEPATIAFEDSADVLLLEDEVLLLEEVLVDSEPVSRVVQLFAPDSVATPGQMQARIERHLARGEGGEWDSPYRSRGDAIQRDEASVALHAALSDIRRTLGQR